MISMLGQHEHVTSFSIIFIQEHTHKQTTSVRQKGWLADYFGIHKDNKTKEREREREKKN